MDTTPLRRTPKEEPEDEGWLITFADMAVLLMCFFLLMYALTMMTPQTVANIAKSLRDTGFYDASRPQHDPISDVKKQIVEGIGKRGYDAYMPTYEVPEGMAIEFAASDLFEGNGAKFKSTALPMLSIVAGNINAIAKEDIIVEVEGYTDDSLPDDAQYPTNWELSAARAANVVRYFTSEQFPASKLRVVALGDAYPKAANRDAAGNPIPANQNLNRRVVVRILRGADN